MRLQAQTLRSTVAAGYRSHLSRTAERQRFTELLSCPPLGPLVLSGPEGAGTSNITEAALAGSGTPLVVMVKLGT